MHRFRALLLLAAFLVLVLPVPVAAAGLPLLDPEWHIVPDPSVLDSTCKPGSPLGIGGVLVLLQNLMNAAVSLTVIVMTLVIAYAGFLFLTSPFNSENRSKAKTTLWNTVVGVFLVLAAWLIMDFAMKILYNPQATFAGKAIGPWNQVLVGGDACIKSRVTSPLFDLIPSSDGPRTDPNAGSGPGVGGGQAGPGQPASLGAGKCSPSDIARAAAAGGYRLTDAQANTFSCLAKYESACGANISGAKTEGGQSTTAHGMFQVVMGYDDKCHNLNIPVCTEAARKRGYTVQGDLDCSKAFRGGKVRPGMEYLANACRAASTDLACNASASACLLQNRPNFGDWTSDPRSSGQKACVRTFNI
ncbi:MAG: pilin [Patescibacteria group bacterium]